MTDHQPLVAMFGPNKPTPAIAANRFSMGSVSSTIQLHHRVPQDVGTIPCWCPQSTASRWRSRFRQRRKHRRRGHRLYHWNTEFASGTNRHGYVAESVFSRSNFDEGHAIHERRLAREKDGNDPAEKFRKIADSLGVCYGCLLYGARVVIPTKLRRQVLDLLRECYFGIQRMKQLARTAV